MDVLRNLSLVSQVGFSMVTPILLCVFIGNKLEASFHFPFTVIFIIIGVVSGCAASFRLLISAVKMADKSKEKGNVRKTTNFVSPKRGSRVFKGKDE